MKDYKSQKFFVERFRRGKMAKDNYQIGSLNINSTTSEVTKDGLTIHLTATEHKLLLHLAKHPDDIISKQLLYEAVWKEPYSGYSNSLMVHIRHIRQKIEDRPNRPRYIVTVKGMGYKLCSYGA